MNPEELLLTEDANAISKINYIYYIKKYYYTIEKVIKLCFNKVDSDNDNKFLNSAIYNDISCVFEILDKLKYSYSREVYFNKAKLYNATNCLNYFESLS